MRFAFAWHAGSLPVELHQDADMGEAAAQPDQAPSNSEPEQPATILAAGPAADASEEIVLRDVEEEEDAGSLPDLEEAPAEGPLAPTVEGAHFCLFPWEPCWC